MVGVGAMTRLPRQLWHPNGLLRIQTTQPRAWSDSALSGDDEEVARFVLNGDLAPMRDLLVVNDVHVPPGVIFKPCLLRNEDRGGKQGRNELITHRVPVSVPHPHNNDKPKRAALASNRDWRTSVHHGGN
jgi:hypothetical protein